MQPTAKSLILDLLSTLRGGAMPVRALVAAAALFEIAENSLRVELARLMAHGLVERNERGQYKLAAGAGAVQSRVTSWARLEDLMVRWDGGWIGVHTGHLPRTPRRTLRRRARALELLGCRELDPGLWVRPDNLRDGVAGARMQLQGFGLDETAPVFALRDLDPATDARARGLWDVAALRAGYRSSIRALAASRRQLPRLPREQAMAETFLLGGRVLRQLAYDPLLPEPLVRAAERRAVITAMRRYDRIGREYWSAFMRAHGAPARRSPANLHLVTAAGPPPAAAGGSR